MMKMMRSQSKSDECPGAFHECPGQNYEPGRPSVEGRLFFILLTCLFFVFG
jgi:hypothetical protein